MSAVSAELSSSRKWTVGTARLLRVTVQIRKTRASFKVMLGVILERTFKLMLKIPLAVRVVEARQKVGKQFVNAKSCSLY